LTLRHALAAVLAVSLPAAAADQPPPPSSYTPVEFTISGGISLGNYEAGLNWAVVRLIKLHTRDPKALMDLPPPRLVAVTGASAGNINALITAIEWCRSDDQDVTPLKSPFYSSWIPVGWDGLFAGDRTCVQYCHDQKLDGKDGWASRVGGGTGEEACLKACRADCTQAGGKDCEDGGPAYRSDDAIFTRRAFLGVEETFRQAIERGKYDPACKLAVGITTTKFHPTLLDVTGQPPEDTQKREEPPHYVPQPYSVNQGELTIATQRYVTALRAETRQGHFGYYEHSFQDDHTLGTYLHLPKVPKSDNQAAVDDVLALTEASSAFPLAFGPRKLRYCRVTEKPTPASAECVANESLTYDWFIDGGAFDNVPLGLGYSLTDAMVTRPDSLSTERRQFFYIDPDRRRYISSPGEDEASPTAAPVPVYPSLSEVLSLAGNFYAVAGKYELQTVARYVWREKPGQPEPKLLIAGRLTPIVGEYLYAFGAFLAEPFRRFDYEVGVYEGAYDYANWVCNQEHGKPGARTEPRCMFDQIKSAYADLGVARVDTADPHSAEPRYVFHALFDREFRTWAALGSNKERPELEALAKEAEAWSKSEGFDLNAPPNPAIGALVGAVSRLHDEEVAAALDKPGAKELATKHQNDFAHFLQLLGKDALEGYSTVEQELLADPQAFTNRAMMSALSRERQIEAEHNNQITTRALSAAQVVLLGSQSSKMLGFEWDPSSIPDDNLQTPGKVAARFIPYRVTGRYAASTGFNLGAGGWNHLEVSFEPTLGLVSDWALIAPIGGYWQFNPGTFGVFATPGVLFRNHEVWFTGADLGLRLSGGLVGPAGFNPSFHVGAELGARLMGGKIRLSAGVDNFASPALVLGIGLVDFNGLLYWGARIAQGK
jgi:hypothetical protein